MGVRVELISWFHLSAGFVTHSALDATLAKLLGRHTWPTIASDVEEFIGKCLECRKLRGPHLISPQVRSDMYDAPFVTIFFDFVGPIRPESPSKNRYLLTAVCPFCVGPGSVCQQSSAAPPYWRSALACTLLATIAAASCTAWDGNCW